MAQTVIGMFESSSKAQEAVQELVQTGISRDRIDVSSGNRGSSSYSSGTATDNDDNQESGIGKFFKSLFGNDDDDADKYTRVASQAQSIVTVHAQSADEAERVADILDDNGAVDVDEHASKLGYSGTGTGSNLTSGTSGYGSSVGSGTTTGLGAVGASTLGATGLAGATGGADYPATGTGGFTGTTGSDLTGSSASDLTGSAGYTGTTGTDLTGSTGSSLTGSTGYTGTTSTDLTGSGTTGSNLTANTTGETSRIPIIEENLEVGKREVRTGGVRVRSRIVERPVEESVRLREEHVNIERNTVNRPASAEDLQNFQERDIEMVERAEVPMVNKEARVVEEVSIGKEVEERNETISDTVRKTEVDVENLDQDDLRGRSTTGNNTL